jgi:hypothetical protein
MPAFFRRALLCALFVCAAWSADPAVDFFQLSDTHLANLDGIHPRLAASLQEKRDSAKHLTGALQHLPTSPAPAFVLITGDLTDAWCYEGPSGQEVSGPRDALRAIFDHSPVPIVPTLGNHDITRYKAPLGNAKPKGDQAVAADARRAWTRFPQFHDGTYYAYRQAVENTTYIFLILDDGDGFGNNRDFQAGEVAWLKSQLAEHAREPVILAIHIPIEGADFWPAVKPMLARYPNVVLSIAGHKHTDGIDQVDLGTRSLPQIRTAALFISEGNARHFRLREDRIEVFATGKPEELVKTIRLAGGH